MFFNFFLMARPFFGIYFLNGYVDTDNKPCFDNNDSNIIDLSEPFYWIKTCISIISSCNGTVKLLKKGPVRLIARNSGFMAQFLLFSSVCFFILFRGLSIIFLGTSSAGAIFLGWILLVIFVEVITVWYILSSITHSFTFSRVA